MQKHRLKSLRSQANQLIVMNQIACRQHLKRRWKMSVDCSVEVEIIFLDIFGIGTETYKNEPPKWASIVLQSENVRCVRPHAPEATLQGTHRTCQRLWPNQLQPATSSWVSLLTPDYSWWFIHLHKLHKTHIYIWYHMISYNIIQYHTISCNIM